MPLAQPFRAPDGWTVMVMADVPVGWEYTNCAIDLLDPWERKTDVEPEYGAYVLVMAREKPKGPLTVQIPRHLVEAIDRAGTFRQATRWMPTEAITTEQWDHLVDLVRATLRLEQDNDLIAQERG